MEKWSRIARKTLEELDLPIKFSCRVVAMERMGQAIAVPDQKTVVKEGDILALMGNPKGIEAFRMTYERRRNLKQLLKF